MSAPSPYLNLGDADPLIAEIPELADLVRSLLWLVDAAHPMKARTYDGAGGGGSARAVERPDPGAPTRRYRGRLRTTRRKIADLHLFIESAFNENREDSGGPRATCGNVECDRYGRRLRFGSVFCDRCGGPAIVPEEVAS